MKKIMSIILSLMLILIGTAALADFNPNGDIVVISREDGSGTRAAFVELSGVEIKDANGKKIDRTTAEAEIVNGTSTVLTSVSSDPQAIGYISMGAVNDTVKTLKIDGVQANAADVLSGNYKISRSFNLAVLGKLEEKDAKTQDFIAFILSNEGQKIISDNGYISIGETKAYEKNQKASGKIICGGSSSVSPVMEKLIEGYKAFNDKVEVELQMSDSSTGITNTAEGLFDIGMASRELKDSEKEKGLSSISIAKDGIVLIVNHSNPLENLSKEQLMQIYIGEISNWQEIK